MNWGMWIVRGIASIIFGILTLWVPRVSIAALVILFGVYAIVDGLVMFGVAAGERDHRLAYILRGLLGIAAGVIAFARPDLTAISLYLLIGAWAVASGIMELVAASTLRHQVKHVGGLVLTGVLTLVFGIVMFASPAIGVPALLGFIAAYAILNGIAEIGIGMRIHELVHPRSSYAAAS